MRAEYNHREGRKNGEQYVDKSTLDWFPNFLFDHQVSDNFNWGFSYTKRIDRPAWDALDPSFVAADSLTTQEGNPALNSIKSHIF